MLSESKNSLSVFMPFYNEEELIDQVIEESYRFLGNLKLEFELIIVDDGSKDKTPVIADNLAQKHEEIKVFHHETNKGYGRALATGFEKAQNELIFYADGDGQFDITELRKFLQHMPEYDLVIGYRKNRQDSLSRIITSKIFNSLTRKVLAIDAEDIDCGFKLVKKEVLESISLETERTTDAELLAKASAQNLGVKELPVNHRERDRGESEAEGLIGVKTTLIIKTLEELMYIRRSLK